MAVNDLVYEVDEKGQRILVRSLNSEHSVFIRFINRVSRPIDVWWRDFQGRRRHYARMEPRTYFNVDTYVTHPWEFTDPATHERYVINNKEIFRAPRSLGGMRHRTNWLISVKVRSLRYCAMLALSDQIRERQDISQLGLPQPLANDLSSLVRVIQHTPPPPQRS